MRNRRILRGQRFVSVTLACAFLLSVACGERKTLMNSLRCGMTRQEVTQVARQYGFKNSDASWLSRTIGRKTSTDLTMLDFTFRDDRLVAVRQGSYDRRTKQVTYRSVDLCAQPPR